jgi:predicted component of type VI protein secretion system
MRLAVLITALLCLVAAGCSTSAPTTEQVHADWVAKVNAAIKDPARAQRVAEQGGEFIDEEQSMVAALKAAADQLAELNTDYTATDTQFMAAYRDYESKRKAAQTRFTKGVFALRKEVSAEEWKEITK